METFKKVLNIAKYVLATVGVIIVAIFVIRSPDAVLKIINKNRKDEKNIKISTDDDSDKLSNKKPKIEIKSDDKPVKDKKIEEQLKPFICKIEELEKKYL